MPLKSELQQLIADTSDEALLQKLAQELKAVKNHEKNSDVFSELKTAREENQQLKNQLEKFYSIISYDLGSPLNSLKMLADFLMMDVEQLGNSSLTDSVGFLHAQIEKLQRQMGNMIEWSSLEVKNYSLKSSEFDLGELIGQVISLYTKSMSDKGILLSVNLPEEGVTLNADRRMMQIVLSNLVSNAVKFCRKADSIAVEVTQSDDLIRVAVKDTGIGMSKAKMDNVFNPGRKNVQRGTANEAGLGLGLITTKAILALHHSVIEMESEQGKGSVFAFTVPFEAVGY